MAGARLTEVQYTNGDELKAVYDASLPPQWKHLVYHIPQADTTVDCPIRNAGEQDDIPGTWWDGDYVWPAPPTPEIPEATEQQKDDFIDAANEMLLKTDPIIIQHIRYHEPDTDACTAKYLELMSYLNGVD